MAVGYGAPQGNEMLAAILGGGGGETSPTGLATDPEGDRLKELMAIIGGSYEREEYTPKKTGLLGGGKVSEIAQMLSKAFMAGSGPRGVANVGLMDELKQRRERTNIGKFEMGQRKKEREYGAKRRSAEMERNEILRKRQTEKADNRYSEGEAAKDRRASEGREFTVERAETDHEFRMKEVEYRAQLADESAKGKENKVAQAGGRAILGYASGEVGDMKSPEGIKAARDDMELVLDMNGATDFEKQYWLRKFDARFPMPEEAPVQESGPSILEGTGLQDMFRTEMTPAEAAAPQHPASYKPQPEAPGGVMLLLDRLLGGRPMPTSGR